MIDTISQMTHTYRWHYAANVELNPLTGALFVLLRHSLNLLLYRSHRALGYAGSAWLGVNVLRFVGEGGGRSVDLRGGTYAVTRSHRERCFKVHISLSDVKSY